MAQVVNRRMTAGMQGDYVVFLIGMRMNKLWKIHKWLPAFRLAKAAPPVPAAGYRTSAAARLGREAQGAAPAGMVPS